MADQTETTQALWQNRIVRYEQVAPYSLLDNPFNFRVHSQLQQTHLVTLLEQVGWVDVVKVNQNSGRIVDGHLRVEKARQEGEATVPVLWLDLTDEEEQLVLATLDWITEQAEVDVERLQLLLAQVAATELLEDDSEILEAIAESAGFTLDAGDYAEVEDPGAQIERADELREKWGTELGQLWQLGEHRVLCGDSRSPESMERLFGDKRYQAVVTSPPYFLERSYETDFSPEDARDLLRDVANTWFEYCKDGGYFFDNFAGIQGFELAKAWAGVDRCEYPAALIHWPIFVEAGWRLHAERIWTKPHAMCVGLWVLSSNRPVFSWEYLWTWRKGTGKEILGPSELRTRGVWDTTGEAELHRLKDLGHDASFHIALPTWAIEVHSQKGDLIGEPFLGTGTTLIASERLGRICYGVEQLPNWVAVTLERFFEVTGKEPVLVE